MLSQQGTKVERHGPRPCHGRARGNDGCSAKDEPNGARVITVFNRDRNVYKYSLCPPNGGYALLYPPFLLSSPYRPTMRWPRIRKTRVESDPNVTRQDSNDDTAQDPPTQDNLTSSKPTNPSGPGLSRMFSDAALYEKILNACPETLKNGCFFNADDQTLPNCLGGFNQLIGRDLGDVERAVTGQLAKLSVNNWVSSTDDPFGVDTSEEERGEERGEITSSDEGEDKKEAPPSEPQTLEEEPPGEPSESKLTSEEVVDLLEQEFGALAPPGEEKLLLETDAAFFNDVVVLVSHPTALNVFNSGLHPSAIVKGVIHLTTHRFTFHASLLSSQPGDSQKVIKSGSALIHRKGWRRKRKVWLQLDNDMISSFPSSRDEDKIKPLRSILRSYLDYSSHQSSVDPILQYHRSEKSSLSTGSDLEISASSSSLNVASPRQLSSLIPSKLPGTGETNSEVCISLSSSVLFDTIGASSHRCDFPTSSKSPRRFRSYGRRRWDSR